MCWIEKDHQHTCPWCIKDFDVSGSGEEFSGTHYDENCPHCGKPLKWDEDAGGDPEKGEVAGEVSETQP